MELEIKLGLIDRDAQDALCALFTTHVGKSKETLLKEFSEKDSSFLKQLGQFYDLKKGGDSVDTPG